MPLLAGQVAVAPIILPDSFLGIVKQGHDAVLMLWHAVQPDDSLFAGSFTQLTGKLT